MMPVTTASAATLCLLFVIGNLACARPPDVAEAQRSEPARTPATAVAVSAAAPVPVQAPSSRAGQLVFADRVWRVEESNTVAKYTTYIFLADRTLIVDSWKGIPGIGKWEFEEGKLALIEEGIRYPAAILELKDDRFRLRIDGPGEPVRLDLRENRPE